MMEVTDGHIDSAHFGPDGDTARHIASYCDGSARVHVYTAAFEALATTRSELAAKDALLNDCEPYLKDGQSPSERMKQDHEEILGLMKLLEKTKWALQDAVSTNVENCRLRDKHLHDLTAAHATIHQLGEAVAPVMDWYQSDEHPERPLPEIIADIVSDLQQDRATVLRTAPHCDEE